MNAHTDTARSDASGTALYGLYLLSVAAALGGNLSFESAKRVGGSAGPDASPSRSSPSYR